VASGHAAIQLHADLTSINGMDAVIMPGIHIKGNNPSFATHQLRDGTLNVSVQTEQSSARHTKDQIAAMIAERGYQLPSIVADLDGIGQFNALEFAHGIEDAVIRDCRLGDVPFMMSDIGEAIYRSRPRDVSAHYAYYPYSLVYGGWNSHQGQTGYKFPPLCGLYDRCL
jgi:CRISPR-associated protein Csb1